MTLVMGVDPGLNGALVVYDTDSGGLVSVEDMPTWMMAVGGKKRKRIDAVSLADTIDTAKLIGVDLVVIEAVGGRPKQSASAGFVFGYTVGLLYMACVMHRLPIETVPPQHWKKLMRVPGKARVRRDDAEAKALTDEQRKALSKTASKDAELAIVHRADELFPDSRNLWRGARGGYMLDRAEAALLAKFGGDHVLRSLDTGKDWRNAYRELDTGV